MESITAVNSAAKVGGVIHNYAEAVRRHDDQEIDWIREELDVVRWQLSQLGTGLHEMQSGVGRERSEEELAQLGKLVSVHDAINRYERRHPAATGAPEFHDPDYVLARDGSAEIVAYFTQQDEDGRPDVTFMPQFTDAMNVRIEFITRLHPDWASDEGLKGEIERAAARLEEYIAELKELIDDGFVIAAESHPELDPRTEQAVNEVCEVTVEDRGKVVATRTVRIPPESDPDPTLEQMQRAAVHDRLRLVRNRQTLAITGFERTLKVWKRWLRAPVPS